MTGREMIDFLQTLDDEELEADVEIKLDYRHISKNSYVWVAGIGADCNGVYICDEGGADLFDEHRTNGDKSSWEVER